MNRSEYIKQFLVERGAPEQSLRVRELTFSEVQRMSTYELEWHQIENSANLEKASHPATDKRAEIDDVQWANFVANRYLSPEQREEAAEALQRLCREYPAFVNNQQNQEQLSAFLTEQKQLPRWDTVRGAFLELASTGRLFLDPSRVGIVRLGDEGVSGYAVGQLTAAELKQITTPRRQSLADEINAMSADEYYRSEHGRALREERNRRADQAIIEQQVKDADRAVDLFLMSHRDYARTDGNKRRMLEWIAARNWQITTTTLHEAYVALKSNGDLALTNDNSSEHGSNRVIDYSDLGERNPMHYRPARQHVELVEQKSVKKITMADVRKMSADEFAAAQRNTDLWPQIEELLNS